MISALALALALSQPAGSNPLAQMDGTFPGTLFCEASGTVPALRVPVNVTLDGASASYAVDGPSGARESGRGTVATRQLVLTGRAGGGVTYQARYAGEISGRGGLLTGAQTGTAGGKAFSRKCQMTLGLGRG